MKKSAFLLVLSLSLLALLNVNQALAGPPTGQTTTGTTGPTGQTTTGPTGPTGQTTTGPTGPTTVVPIRIDNPFKAGVGDSLFSLLKTIVDKIVLPIGGVLCVLAFIYAGFSYVMAQGNSTKIENANRMLLFASIGTAVLLGAWVIANAICKTINLLGGPVCAS
jgi:hypothetical protein